jgi:phage terminase large subunit
MVSSKRFRLCGGNLAAYRDTTSKELLLAGAAGTGKTLSNLCKVLKFGQDYPGARMLIVRKTRHSLTETALVTWERDVLGDGHVIIGKPIDRMNRHSYKFPNRSVLVTAGMDRPDKVLSSEWDLIYVNEATDLALTDWETLGGRLRAGAGAYDQIIGDCNPTTPHHWLYKRCLAGACTLYATHHWENPRFYDQAAGKWTADGNRYVGGRLKKMTGARRSRFYEGKWVSAEGQVYAYDPAHHNFPMGWMPPSHWRRVWSIDWGLSAPTVLQVWAYDGDGRMYLCREVYKTRLPAHELGRVARAWVDRGDEPQPEAIVCDHNDPDAKSQFEEASGLRGELADKEDRDRGIRDCQERFDLKEDNRPSVFFHPHALDHEPDATLINDGRPTSTLEELAGYVYDPRFLKDEPIAENDHGMDAMRYADRKVRHESNMSSVGNPYRTETGAAARVARPERPGMFQHRRR